MNGFRDFKLRVADVEPEQISILRVADSVALAVEDVKIGKVVVIHVPVAHVNLYRSCIPTKYLGCVAVVGSETERAGETEQSIVKALDFCPTCGWARGSHELGPKRMIACSCPKKRKAKK